jgi:hypothetical protein
MEPRIREVVAAERRRYRRHLTQGVARIAETLWQRDQAPG